MRSSDSSHFASVAGRGSVRLLSPSARSLRSCMDRLELTTRDNPTIFLPLSLTGIALNGVGWIVLGLWLVSRRERP